ncbi:MAG: GNAT family N-acetyltransferase [Xanthobacteraceae bacterium]|nr:GNAT family N-acetyltransferase [Xanthobacteraceae bacterium]
MSVAVVDLRRQPRFRDVIADRVWRAWWRERGTPLAELTAWVDGSLTANAIPFMMVAHDGPDFAGAASVIASDLAERPQYTPWVATVWVEPQFRGRGIGRALVARAAAAAFALGHETLYLCAREQLHDFYAGQGWLPLERGVGERQLMVFSLRAAPAGRDVGAATPIP